jgi:hypothetical protein
MKERVAEASPRFEARIAGVFYLLNIVTGVFAERFVGGRLVVYGDAAATARNILAHKHLFRLGLASALLCVACYIAVAALFYILFKPVNRSLSLLAAFFSLVGCAVQAFMCIFLLAPLIFLGGAQPWSVFNVDQLQALALLFFRLYGQGWNVCLVFFGFYFLLIGYLIFRSTFLPQIVGVLMAIDGLAWLANSFASFLLPPLANYLSRSILPLALLGEGSLTLWLIVVGVNVQRWKERASAAGGRA